MWSLPDIPSRRESNLSASDWDPDEELETKMNRLPPLPESISENDLYVPARPCRV